MRNDRRKPQISPGGKVIDPKGVNHPQHYNAGKYEAIDVIEDAELGFNDGNAAKYILRHKHKGSPIKDIEKAIWYLQRHLADLNRKLIMEKKS